MSLPLASLLPSPAESVETSYDYFSSFPSRQPAKRRGYGGLRFLVNVRRREEERVSRKERKRWRRQRRKVDRRAHLEKRRERERDREKEREKETFSSF